MSTFFWAITMKLVIQRVKSASVDVDQNRVGEIGPGLLVLVGVSHDDTANDIAVLAKKTANLRVFDDDQGVMNRSVLETRGDILVVSQFTLYGDCRKGNRPSYIQAAVADKARQFYEEYIRQLRACGLRVESGVFQAEMAVQLINDGPVTLLVESTGR